MIVLAVLAVSWLLFRGLGMLGIKSMSSWVGALRYALAVMFLFTASAHFGSMKEDLIRMMPPWVPRPREFVYFTGACEIVGAIGLLVPGLRRAAGIGLILFLLAVLPANIHAARHKVTLAGRPATPLLLRVPMQVLFIGLVWLASQKRERLFPGPALRGSGSGA